MNKYLSPYIEAKAKSSLGHTYFDRYALDTGDLLYFVVGSSNGWWCSHPGNMLQHKSKQAAIDALDEYLISQGYTLLTQEQYDKLSILA